jgi:uncharacterized protein (TIGR01777 family)
MRIFLTGGTGLVGTRLVKRLVDRGDEVVVLTRRPAPARELLGPAVTAVEGDPAVSGEWMAKAMACDGVINLAGENLFARRWDESFKKVLIDSRVNSTQNVARALAQAPRRTDGTSKVLVSASAVGIYGPHRDEELTEGTPPGSDFLAKLCVEWEQATEAATAAGVRTAIVRVGVVLDKNGGALAKLLTPFKLGVGGAVGGGKQWMSWIHHQDLGSLFLLALDDSRASGPLNGTAPNPVTNGDFAKALGRVMRRPTFMPTPALALRLAFGEVADVITLGQRVRPSGPLALGLSYAFPSIDAALTDIIR